MTRHDLNSGRLRCTLCGGHRELREPEFSFHATTRQHQLAVREFDLRHQNLTHHDWHVLLKIACNCAATNQNLEKKAAA